MGSSFANNLAFDNADAYEFSAQAFAPAASSRVDQLLETLGPKMMAMGGLALFAFALIVAFRIIALDAVRQLQEPAIDFAICGAVAFLGLSISWVHLGDRAQAEAEDVAGESAEFAIEPMQPVPVPELVVVACHAPAVPAASASSVPLRKPTRQLWRDVYACRFCGQKMTSVGQALYRCRTCRHLESNGHISFLDSAFSCNCQHCRHSEEQTS
ncbi:MAG TPA: hypothetical protein VFK81_04595 [Terriglobales bacterium]|jgi:hypothetical protein|nr:hypothetical protein [Terriglobales bacterium]